MKFKHLIFLPLALFFFFSCQKNEVSKVTIKQNLLVDLSKLNNEIILFQKLTTNNSSEKEIIEQFKKSRLSYKKVEWAIEYFIPETARFMNGPALDEMELEENKSFEPHGFQVME